MNYEYAVIFTSNHGKYVILIKEANGSPEAIRLAINEAVEHGKTFTAVEAISIV